MADPGTMFNIGQAIGQAVSRSRFNRGATKLEEEFAGEGGVDPERLPEFDARVRDLARSSGMTRRGMLDEVEYLKQFREQEELNARRRLGAEQAANPQDPSSLYTGYGMDQLRRGNLPGGMQAAQTGRDIQRTMAAVGPDGQLNQGALSQGAMRSAAEQGDTGKVSQFAEQANKAADMNYGRALSILQSGGKLGGMDEVIGWVNEGLKTDSRWGSGLELRRDNGGKTWVTRNGEAMGTGLDDNEVGQYLQQLTQDPSSLGEKMRTLSAEEAAATRKSQREMQEYGSKAMIDVFSKDPVIGEQAMRVSSGAKALEDAGWKLNGTPQVAPDGSTTQMATVGNRLVQIRQTPADAEDPMAGKIQIIDATTNAPINPAELGAAAGPAQQYMQAAAAVSQANVDASIKDRIFRARSIQQLMQGNGFPAEAGTGDPVSDGVQRILGLETSGDPNAKNPRSTATGLGQFIDSTWLQIAPKIANTQGMSQEQILALRSDPALSRAAVEAYARDNAQALGQAGLPVSGETLYLAHHFGPEGARALMSVPPETPVGRVLDPTVLAANPTYKNMTVGEMFDSFDRRAGGTALPPREARKPAPKATAAAAPAKRPESALQRESTGVRGQAKQLRAANADYQQATQALAKFEQDFQPQESAPVLDPRIPAVKQTNLTEQQSQAYAALKREVDQARARLEALTKSTRSRTEALSRSTTTEQGRRLAAQYRPGSTAGGAP